MKSVYLYLIVVTLICLIVSVVYGFVELGELNNASQPVMEPTVQTTTPTPEEQQPTE